MVGLTGLIKKMLPGVGWDGDHSLQYNIGCSPLPFTIELHLSFMLSYFFCHCGCVPFCLSIKYCTFPPSLSPNNS